MSDNGELQEGNNTGTISEGQKHQEHSFQESMMNVVKRRRSTLLGTSDNNTTSILKYFKAKNGLESNQKLRRVSFAPDVTLHAMVSTDRFEQNVRHPSLSKIDGEDLEDSEMEFTNPISSVLQKPQKNGTDMVDLQNNAQMEEVYNEKSTMDITELFVANKKLMATEPKADTIETEGTLKPHQEATLNNSEEIEKKEPSILRDDGSDMDISNNESENDDMDFTIIREKPVSDPNASLNQSEHAEKNADSSQRSSDVRDTSIEIIDSAFNENSDMSIDVLSQQRDPSKDESTDNTAEGGVPSREELSPIPITPHFVQTSRTSESGVSNVEIGNDVSEPITHSQDSAAMFFSFMRAVEHIYSDDFSTLHENNNIYDIQDVTFKNIKSVDEVPPAIIYKESFTNKPLSTVLNYSSSEISKKIAQSQSKIIAMEKQMQDNPNKITIFIAKLTENEDSELQNGKMLEFLNVLKVKSDLETQNLWLNWRSQIFKNIFDFLQENLEILQAEYQENKSFKKNIIAMHTESLKLQDNFIRESEKKKIIKERKKLMQTDAPVVSELTALPTFEQRLKWAEKRQHLMSKYSVDIGEVSTFESRKSDVITELNKLRARSNVDTLPEVTLKNFKRMASKSKLAAIVTKMHKDTIIVSIESPNIEVIFSNISDPKDVSSIKITSSSSDSFTKFWISHLSLELKSKDFTDKNQFFTYFLGESDHFCIVHDSFKMLQLLFQTKLIPGSFTGLIEFQVLDKWKKTTFQIKYSQFVELVLHGTQVTPKITATQYTSALLSTNPKTLFSRKEIEILPWLSKICY